MSGVLHRQGSGQKTPPLPGFVVSHLCSIVCYLIFSPAVANFSLKAAWVEMTRLKGKTGKTLSSR